MSVSRMNNFFIRSCILCSAIRQRTCKNRFSIFPTPTCFLPKCYQSSSTHISSNLTAVNLNEDFDYDAESPYSNIDFEAIANGDEEKLKNLKVLQLEIDLMRQQGKKVPNHLTGECWKELLSIPISDYRVKYLKHLWLIEVREKLQKEKAKKKSENYSEFKARQAKIPPKNATTSSPIVYSLTDTSLFHRLYDVTINRLYNYKLLQAEWFGPKVIVDCSYEAFMTSKNLSNCAKQMMIMWSENRDHCNPCDLVFCNVNEQGALWQKLTGRMPMIRDVDSPVHFTAQHYLDVFPKKQLVYLTPNCSEILEKFNTDDIYIIGAFVDTGRSQPISLAKAKKEGLRMAKLPLDKYLCWAIGHKTLTLNQVLSILNDVKDGQSWPQAFRHVPKRKLAAAPILIEKENIYKLNPLTTQAIRENYRRNFVYDLLLKDQENSSQS